MMYFVHRDNNVITCVSTVIVPGYAEESLDDGVAELSTFLTPIHTPPLDPSDSNGLSKALKAILILAATGGTGAGKTPAQIRAAFLAAWNSLP